jgi:two-component system NarL family response regulator
MRVILADDHRLLIEGLSNLLNAHGFEVIGIAKNGAEAIHLTQKFQPDVILMDIMMPGHDGLSATRLIKEQCPEVKVVILSTSDDDHDLFEAVKFGADGYLLKSMTGEELIGALNDLEHGETPLSPCLTPRLLSEFSKLSKAKDAYQADECTHHQLMEKLTDRQFEVLQLVAKGMTYKKIGKHLAISERTVRFHMSEAIQRLHLQNRNQVLSLAEKLGLNTLNSPET